MRKYNLTITEKQASLINKALDFYSRIQMGQLDEMVSSFSGPLAIDLMDRNIDTHEVESKMKEVKQILFPELNGANFAIGNPSRPDESRICYDIQQVIRNKVAWDNYEKVEGKYPMGVCYDTPMKFSTTEELPTIETIEED